jgi:hypothetical protein
MADENAWLRSQLAEMKEQLKVRDMLLADRKAPPMSFLQLGGIGSGKKAPAAGSAAKKAPEKPQETKKTDPNKSNWQQEVTRLKQMKQKMMDLKDKYKEPPPEDPAKVNRWDTFLQSSASYSMGSVKAMQASFKPKDGGSTGTAPKGPWRDMGAKLYPQVISSKKFLDYLCASPAEGQCGEKGDKGASASTGNDLVANKIICDDCKLFKGSPALCTKECAMCAVNPEPQKDSDFCVASQTPGQNGAFTVTAYAKCKDKNKVMHKGSDGFKRPYYAAKSDQYLKWKAACKGLPVPAGKAMGSGSGAMATTTKREKGAACEMLKKADEFFAKEAGNASEPSECIYDKTPGPKDEYTIVSPCAARFGLSWQTCTCPTATFAPAFECAERYKPAYACTNHCTDAQGNQAYQMMQINAATAVPLGNREARYKVPMACRRWFIELENRWHTHWMREKRDTALELASMDCSKADNAKVYAAAGEKPPSGSGSGAAGARRAQRDAARSKPESGSVKKFKRDDTRGNGE